MIEPSNTNSFNEIILELLVLQLIAGYMLIGHRDIEQDGSLRGTKRSTLKINRKMVIVLMVVVMLIILK
jgi:uncharacterized membrane protein